MTPNSLNQIQLPLSGYSLVCFESRQADLMRQIFEKKGAQVISAPSVQEIPHEQNPEAYAFAEKLLAKKIDLVIFMTGVGTRYLMKVLEKKFNSQEIIEALKKITLVARGPKATQALREIGLVSPITVPEPNTWLEILEELDQNPRGIDLKNCAVAVQEYGTSNVEFIEELKKRGSNVTQIPVYRWAMPENREPLNSAVRCVVEGRAQGILWTSAIQIKHALKASSELGLEEAFRQAMNSILIVSIGPTTTETLQQEGIHVGFEPTHSKMGTLAKELAEKAPMLFKGKSAHVEHVTQGDLSQSSKTNLENSIFLKACRREKTERTPIWLMRQAGRYQKTYREIRGQFSFLELCKNKEAVAQVTLNAVNELGVDAAIIFSDILVILEPMGFGLDYIAGGGPVIEADIQGVSSIRKIPNFEPSEKLGYVMDAIKLTRQKLPNDIPLIGFSGAPFTLASYLLEGGSSKNFIRTKTLMFSDEKAWHELLEKITQLTTKYLLAQVRAGANAIQIFDSWAGILNADDYARYVLPHSRELLKKVSGLVPVIHFGTGTSPFLDVFASAGADVVGIDSHISFGQGRKMLGDNQAAQGNLDPVMLFADQKKIKEEVIKILKEADGKAGHIFNLGHGILPKTPEENVKYLVHCVREFSSQSK